MFLRGPTPSRVGKSAPIAVLPRYPATLLPLPVYSTCWECPRIPKPAIPRTARRRETKPDSRGVPIHMRSSQQQRWVCELLLGTVSSHAFPSWCWAVTDRRCSERHQVRRCDSADLQADCQLSASLISGVTQSQWPHAHLPSLRNPFGYAPWNQKRSFQASAPSSIIQRVLKTDMI